jgi:hypothetical protein
MHQPRPFVGIDVSVNRLDVVDLPADNHFSVPYTEADLASLLRRLKDLKPQIVLLEATGATRFP